MKTGQELISDLMWFVLVPPAGAFCWLLFSRGWTNLLGTTDSTVVRGWTKSGFWIVLIILYAMSIGLFVYAYFMRG